MSRAAIRADKARTENKNERKKNKQTNIKRKWQNTQNEIAQTATNKGVKFDCWYEVWTILWCMLMKTTYKHRKAIYLNILPSFPKVPKITTKETMLQSGTRVHERTRGPSKTKINKKSQNTHVHIKYKNNGNTGRGGKPKGRPSKGERARGDEGFISYGKCLRTQGFTWSENSTAVKNRIQGTKHFLQLCLQVSGQWWHKKKTRQISS